MANKKDISENEKKTNTDEMIKESELIDKNGKKKEAEDKSKDKTSSEEKAAEELSEDREEETQDETEGLKEQVKSWNDRYLRLMAEFDNYKKRSSREYQSMVDSANERLMTDLVDVRENFERAIKNGEQSSDYNTLFDGLKLIFSKLDIVLKKYGLEIFASPGDEFDPQLHDALMKVPHEEIPEGHIADIYERGYLLKGKVMKHARVIVSSGMPENDAVDGDSKK